mmetsp:Transcript_64428/g.129560  ORF Transcript_64428/g.129560 Transcript_64428/m.129560 type:complete len:107 (+) Transcript_64428:245-565(+)
MPVEFHWCQLLVLFLLSVMPTDLIYALSGQLVCFFRGLGSSAATAAPAAAAPAVLSKPLGWQLLELLEDSSDPDTADAVTAQAKELLRDGADLTVADWVSVLLLFC